MSKIIVVGSLNMDLVINTPKIPVMGETVLGSSFMSTPGGKGANQAVAAARLGGDVVLIGCVGEDAFGKDLIANVKANGVDVSYIKKLDRCYTGVAIIVIKDGNNFIIVDPGANKFLTPIMMEELEETIAGSHMVMMQLEIPLETAEKAISIAKKHNVKVLLDPAPAVKLSSQILSKVDILIPNETECEIITGRKINSVEDAKAAVALLNSWGIRTAIITMGEKGVVYNNHNEVLHIKSPKVKAIDTTAAGDAFSGALAVALSSGQNIDDAIDFANIVGALTVTKKGAQESLPTSEAVDDFRKRNNAQKGETSF